MNKLFILFAVFGIALASCRRSEVAPPQAPTPAPKAQSLITMGSEAWDPMTRHCDRIGRGCKEDVILCLTPEFPQQLFAVLNAGMPEGIKTFFNNPQHSKCLPAQLTGDADFMALVNEEKMYSVFYEEATNPKRRIYLFGDHPDLTITDNLLIVPITYP